MKRGPKYYIIIFIETLRKLLIEVVGKQQSKDSCMNIYFQLV